jgi:hypothetical protein
MSSTGVTQKEKAVFTFILLVPAFVTMIISIVNYTEVSKLDNDCDGKIMDAKRTSLGMMILSLILFVGLFFILRLNDLFYFSNPFA